MYDSHTKSTVIAIDLGREPVSNENTVGKFRHSLDKRDLATKSSLKNYHCLGLKGIMVSSGIIVDASVINTLSSPKIEKCDTETASVQQMQSMVLRGGVACAQTPSTSRSV